MAQYLVMKGIINKYAEGIADIRLRKMFLDCFFNTLDTTTEILEDGTSYVFTGDIPAMWLRDSSVQVTGYLPYVKQDKDVNRLVRGLLKRQFMYIELDPYANAFNKSDNGMGHHDDVNDSDSGWIWERKFEIDSLCYPMWLAEKYYNISGDSSVFDSQFEKVAEIIMDLFITEQRHFENSKYRHHRPKYPEYPTLTNNGLGNPVAYSGMVWSGYRPSDDVCDYNYLIPSNMFAVTVLRFFINVFEKYRQNNKLLEKAKMLIAQIQEGIDKFGIVEHKKYGKIYAYETDGMNNYNLMDDANVPSLLSLPYIGYCGTGDEIYKNTRSFVLSKDNPYYYSGKFASGIGSPHTPDKYIWHIGLIMQLLTSTDEEEIKKCFDMIINTDGGCGFMHEGFNPDNPKEFTREWFAWANTLFSLAVMKIFPLHQA